MKNSEKLYFVGDVINGRYHEPFRSYEAALQRYYDDVAENLIIETERDRSRVNDDQPVRTQEEILRELGRFYFVMLVHFDAEGDEISSEVVLGENIG
jgi:hypothetical protein